MADFNIAYNITMMNEGGYSLDPDDAGGETYKGISRRYNPTWSGWERIDIFKGLPDFPKNLEGKNSIQDAVKIFYKQIYWDRFLGDNIDKQNVAMEMFDTSVNMGVSKACIFLQQALNLLNRNGSLFNDMIEDGFMGNITINTLNEYCKKETDIYLLKIMNILQGMHYINYMKKSPIQEKYARGWLERVEIKDRRNI